VKTPEKIYGWLNSQLSIARFYGSCTFNGHTYVIDETDPDKPLVRQDVLKSKKKERKKITKEQAQAAWEALLKKAEQKPLL
jgi:hypothetical protein